MGVRPVLSACLAVLLAAGCSSDDREPLAATSTASPATTADPAPTPPPPETTADVAAPASEPRPTSAPFVPVDEATSVQQHGEFGQGLALWQQRVPAIDDVRLLSAADGTEQPALWLPAGDRRPAPLLVVLHSWSSGYLQHSNIPLGMWAERNGWAMIAPNFRGANTGPQTTGSDLAVQDVIDAIDFAVGQGGVDPERVVAIGYSGGGMMSLLVAGRHPDRFAAAVSWVPVYDLVDWYDYVEAGNPSASYDEEIATSCGGAPTEVPAARQDCQHRSPSAHLPAAGRANLPVYVGHGVDDTTVPPDYGLRAFNDLAEPTDRLDETLVAALRANSLPADVSGSVQAQTYFAPGDPDVLFARESGPATLVVFDGEHDMVYNPGLAWAHHVVVQGSS